MIDVSIKTKSLSLTDTFLGIQVQNKWIGTGGVAPPLPLFYFRFPFKYLFIYLFP